MHRNYSGQPSKMVFQFTPDSNQWVSIFEETNDVMIGKELLKNHLIIMSHPISYKLPHKL